MLMALGGAYVWIMRWSKEEMQLISRATGAACGLLALGLLVGEFFGFGWMLHPWTVVGIKSLAPTVAGSSSHGGGGGGGRRSGSCTDGGTLASLSDGASAITQSFSDEATLHPGQDGAAMV